jgi:hypothetical protein
MNVRTFRYITWIIFFTLVSMATVLSSCGGETVFPKQPEAHRLYNEVQEWPDEYYWLVAAGVSSRVMGLRSADELLSEFKEQWVKIEALDSAEELISYFDEHDLAPIAEAIQQTLLQNSALEPSIKTHRQLQTDAIKRGLVYAFWEVKGELPR